MIMIPEEVADRRLAVLPVMNHSVDVLQNVTETTGLLQAVLQSVSQTTGLLQAVLQNVTEATGLLQAVLQRVTETGLLQDVQAEAVQVIHVVDLPVCLKMRYAA